MRIVWTEQIDSILSVGIWVGVIIGTSNWALTRQEALHALDQLEELGVSILGGEVCHRVGDRIEMNYDSWHCDLEPKESMTSFLQRSLDAARSYIIRYPRDDVFFLIDPDLLHGNPDDREWKSDIYG